VSSRVVWYRLPTANCPRPQLPASNSNRLQRVNCSSSLTHSLINLLHSLTPISESELLYNRRFTANQFVLAPSPLRYTAKVRVVLRPTVSRAVYLCVKHPPAAQDQFLWLSDTCGFVDVRRPLWREDGLVVYNCCWSSLGQSFSGPRPEGLMTIFYCLRFETPPTWRVRSP
jgi:hypothetical protein